MDRELPGTHSGWILVIAAMPSISSLLAEARQYDVPRTPEEIRVATQRVRAILTIKAKRHHLWFGARRSDYLAWVQGVLDGAYGVLVPGYDVGGPFATEDDPLTQAWAEQVNEHLFAQLPKVDT